MVTKDTACNRLIEEGFKASLINGVILVTMDGDQAVNEFRKRLAAAIEDIGYTASWGFSYGQKGITDKDLGISSETSETVDEDPLPPEPKETDTMVSGSEEGPARKAADKTPKKQTAQEQQLTFFNEDGQLTIF